MNVVASQRLVTDSPFHRDPEQSFTIPARYYLDADILEREDVGLCESVQRGLQSKGYNQGRFVVDP